MIRTTLLATAIVCSLSRPALADVGHASNWRMRDRVSYTFCATAYTNEEGCTGKKPGDRGYGITARGTHTRYGVCAADPMIPFGTRLLIEGYGVAVVEDRGGDIKGMRLDVWFQSVPQALAWGRRRVKVVVLE